ncbi:MAG: hypothetical protein ACP5LG_02920 [Conexivisphaera sp.]
MAAPTAAPPRVHLTRGGDVYVESTAAENPDWGFARNLQVILKDDLLEYSTSVFDAPIPGPRGQLHGANRDFSWQGLLAGPVGNRIYKVIDGIYYAPLSGEPLSPLSVRSWRTSVQYLYSDPDDRTYKVDVSLRIEGGTGRLAVRASRPTLFVPILDLRDAESGSTPEQSVEVGRGEATVRSDQVPLAVRLRWNGGSSELGLRINWWYKLGDGFRYVDGDVVRFAGHSRSVYAPLAAESQDGRFDVEIPLPARARNPRCGSGLNESIAKLADSLSAPPGVREAIALRVNRLASFGVREDSLQYPEAGAMWFRRPWARDLVEGLRWNLVTYVEVLGCGEWLSSIVASLLRSALEDGGTRVLPGSREYASDAFPQLLNVAVSAASLLGSAEMLRSAAKVAEAASASLLGEGFSGCRLRDGMVLCPANSSWIDVVRPLGDSAWPDRLPIEWVGSSDPAGLYALVEVNALYIESYSRLAQALRASGERVPARVAGLLEELTDGYRRHFYAPGRLPPLTHDPSTGRSDGTRGSPAVEAMAVLRGLIYSPEDLSGAWSQVEGMIWSRRMIVLGDGAAPFGIVARDVERRPYLGDAEYHGYVLWPRDTPYLLELMEALSMDTSGVLVNNLDHMLAEGAIGYASELFSAPLGGNPSPSGESGNPVPVKNPAQYWSHWCDPYLERFGWRRG